MQSMLESFAAPVLARRLYQAASACSFLHTVSPISTRICKNTVVNTYITLLQNKNWRSVNINSVCQWVTALFSQHPSNQLDMIYRVHLNGMALILLFTLYVFRHFTGMNLAALNSTMSRHLLALLKAETPQNQKHWKDEGLFNFSYGLLFKYARAHSVHSSHSAHSAHTHTRARTHKHSTMSKVACVLVKVLQLNSLHTSVSSCLSTHKDKRRSTHRFTQMFKVAFAVDYATDSGRAHVNQNVCVSHD